MNRKIISGIAVCCAAVFICQSNVIPMQAKAETGGVPGQVDDIAGVGISDASMVLQHYAMTAAGMEGPINDIIRQTGADVNGDDTIDIADATAILQYYASDAAGLDTSECFNVYNVYTDAFNAYRDITADFLSSHSDADPAYDIAYIDDNMIPELILSPSTVHASGGCTIYTYLNGKAILLGKDCFGEMGEVKYAWGESIIVNDMSYTGYRYVTIKNLERGKLTDIMNGSINYLTGEATLNGASSTESAVESAISSAAPYTFTCGRSYTKLSDMFG